MTSLASPPGTLAASARPRPSWQPMAGLVVLAFSLCLFWPAEPVLRWLNPDLAAPDETGRPLPSARLVPQIEASQGHGQVTQLMLPGTPGRFALAWWQDSTGRPTLLLINPVSGEVHDAPRGRTLNQRLQRSRDNLRQTLGAPIPAATLLLLGYLLWARRLLRPEVFAGETGDILVAYASQSGQAASLAHTTAEGLAQRGRRTRLATLNSVDAAQLATTRQALFILSTHGDGEPPDNGHLFARRLLVTQPDLSHLDYGLLALGDSSYPAFCGFGQRVDDWLQACGARHCLPRVNVDRMAPETLARWHTALGALTGLTAPSDETPGGAVPINVATTNASLVSRRQLNTGSPGQGLWEIVLDAPGLPAWRGGDLLDIALQDQLRTYSIASLPESGRLVLLVRAMFHPDGRPGLGSDLLIRRLMIGASVPVRLRPNPGFRAPAADTPLILIGNGTGLAGLLALMHERVRHDARDNWLLFGERSSKHDRPCEATLMAWQRQGYLPHLDRVFSRDNAAPAGARHVQHLLPARECQLADWVHRGAVIAVCGSQAMGDGVDQRLRGLLGPATMDALLAEERYRRDIY